MTHRLRNAGPTPDDEYTDLFQCVFNGFLIKIQVLINVWVFSLITLINMSVLMNWHFSNDVIQPLKCKEISSFMMT